MKPTPIVGLTLNYRDAERTARCVRALLDNGLDHILVWDNSEDGGTSADQLRAQFDGETRASIEKSPHNLGFAAGVNRGLEWIRSRFPGSWVLLINNDAILLPGAVFPLVEALRQNPAAIIAYPDIDHGGRIIGTAYYQRYFGLYTRRRLLGSIPYASGCCQLLAPERLTGTWFDEDFFMYGEDVELGHRLGPAGMIHVPVVLVEHEGSASSGMGSPFYEARMVAAHWILARKLARNRLELGLLLGCRCLTIPSRAVIRALRYRSFTPIEALWHGVKLVRHAWSHSQSRSIH